MDTIGKFKTNFLGKNKSFKIGFNNRSPFSYITATGVGQPSFNDQGVKSFEPSDWKAAFDTSDAVAAEAKSAQKAGEAGGKAFSKLTGGTLTKSLGIDYDEEKEEDPVSRSEMTLDNADPAMLQMFSNWKSSKITNADGSWDEFMNFINAG
ncbi:hypothetical protein CMO95_02350 [Candidatus Woesearchaeota archaeon]|nr:hypothetical protein [Candidatus Woesearchaeota archaeon]